MGLAATNIAPSMTERWQSQRVEVMVYGRYMLEDHSEYPCLVLDMSPGDATFRADHPGELGEKVIAYLEHVGRLEGVITRLLSDGFVMTILASDHKRNKLAGRLTWLAKRHELDLPEGRRHERVVPRNPMSVLHLDDGQNFNCRIIDLSLSGAALEIKARPAVGAAVTLGNMRGKIVRHFEDGIAIEFFAIQREEMLAAEFDHPH